MFVWDLNAPLKLAKSPKPIHELIFNVGKRNHVKINLTIYRKFDSELSLLFSFVVLTRSGRSRSGIWVEYCTSHMETKILGMNQINLWKTFLKIITVIWSV